MNQTMQAVIAASDGKRLYILPDYLIESNTAVDFSKPFIMSCGCSRFEHPDPDFQAMALECEFVQGHGDFDIDIETEPRT